METTTSISKLINHILPHLGEPMNNSVLFAIHGLFRTSLIEGKYKIETYGLRAIFNNCSYFIKRKENQKDWKFRTIGKPSPGQSSIYSRLSMSLLS